MGLQGVFDGALTSLEMGRVMPSARSYRKALEHFGLDPAQTAFVASRPRLLRGAARCGMTAIAFNEDKPTRAAVSLERFSDLSYWAPPLPAKAAG
jgi:FMN phosphatase YigB (HAD superfamily)